MALADPIQSNYTYDPSGMETPDDIARRRKWALAVMQQGMDMSPTEGAGKYAPIVALARALQGGIGGYFAGQADRAERADQAEGMKEGIDYLRGGWAAPTPTTTGHATRQPVATATSPAPPPGVTVDSGGDQPAPGTAPETPSGVPGVQFASPPSTQAAIQPTDATAGAPEPAWNPMSGPAAPAQQLAGLSQGLSPQDRDIAIRTLAGEAGNQGPEGQAAVLAVLRNRLNSGQYGKTLRDVALAKHQFETWGKPGTLAHTISPNSPGYQKIGQLVDTAWASPDDPTKGATNFINADLQTKLGRRIPAWAQGQPSAVIGQHRFFAPAGAAPGTVMAQGGAGAGAGMQPPMALGPTDGVPAPGGPGAAPVQVAQNIPSPPTATDATPPAAAPAAPSDIPAQAMKVLQNPWTPSEVKQAILQQLLPSEKKVTTIKDQSGGEHMIAYDPMHPEQAQEIKLPGVTGGAEDAYPDLQGPQLLDQLKADRPNEAATVEMMLKGMLPPPTSFALSKPQWQQRIAWASRIDPNFDESTWSLRTKTRNAFAPGAQGFKDKQAYNQLVNHLDDVYTKGHQLGNFDSSWYSWVGNRAEKMMRIYKQNPTENNFNTAKEAMVDELVKNWKGGQATDAQVKDWSDQIQSTNSPQQLDGVLQTIAELLAGRAKPYQDVIDSTPYMGDLSFSTPDSKRVLSELYNKTGPSTNPNGAALVGTVTGSGSAPQQHYDFVNGKLVPRQ